MKNSLKGLLNGSPTRFFDDIKSSLSEKTVYAAESVARTVAPSVFEESEQLNEQSGYIAFFNSKRMEIYASSALEARIKAVAAFKPSKGKRHMVHVHLAEKDGKQVTHSTQFVGEEVEPVKEDMGARTIYTQNKKEKRSVPTFVVNKKRRSTADKQNKWADLIKKNQPRVYEEVEQLDENEEHYKGLSSWVSDYQAQRKAGNVKDAIQTRDNIKKKIQQHNLDAKRVWGNDPDKK